jgi:hypothetical protein
MTFIGSPEDAGGVRVIPKTSGTHRCVPDVHYQDFRKSLSLLLLGCFLLRCHSILLSDFRINPPDSNGGARIQFTCIVIDAYLVKRKVNDEEKK